MNAPRARGKLVLAALFVAAVTFILYGGDLKNDFIGWDDDFYILANPYISPLSGAIVRGMFSHFYFHSWTPLTLLAHAIDFRIWALDPRGHHLTNMIIHSLNSVWMLFLSVALLRRYWRRPEEGVQGGESPPGEIALLLGAVGSALLFAVHPLRVEPVACASSLKDLLCTFLALPSILLYLVYSGRRGAPGSWRPLAGSIILYGLSLLAKGSVMTLGGLLLIIDGMSGGFQGGWGRWKRLIVEKTPYLLLGLSAAVVAYIASLGPGTLEQQLRARSDYSSLELGVYDCSFYLVKTLWPANLAELYTFPLRGPFYLFALAAPLGLLLGVVLWRIGYRALLFAIVAYFLALLPMAGFVPSSIQVIANRYAYFAAAPFCVLFGGAVAEGWKHARLSGRSWALPALLVPAAGILALLGAVTVHHVKDWRDAETVWRHAIAVNPGQPLAYNELGRALAEKKEYTGALACFGRAIEISPEFTDALCTMGGVYVSMGDSVDAERVLRRALSISPGDFSTMINLGNLRVLEGRHAEAADFYKESLSINPESSVAAYDLGYTRMLMGHPDEALAWLRRSVSLNPNMRDAYFLIGEILSKQKEREEDALSAYRHAARLGHGQSQRILVWKGLIW
jgi:protein O-mannosyl-transferase